ncbi:hypothetical protein [Roseibacillus ishigakijimensis]|uniref:Uncharacterized protein n=1 Tax=Roseibacillus ishigakijimensis TaxID=454146 RepID=A0A934VI29_9BACT|nr:hypothetical protein [Roseibacillus ishigakijimensis]MBK1834633.1 hypothetical protein [Roseibacillus ishigakijimensis]
MKTLLLLAISSLSLLGQPEGEARPPRTLSLLPLGVHPPFEQEIREDARYEVAPAPGTIPPPTLLLPGADDAPGNRLLLRLRSLSPPIELPPAPDNGTLTLRHPDGSPWCRVPYLAGPATLTLLWRGGLLWDEVRTLPLPNHPGAIPANSCRLINISHRTLTLRWQETVHPLPPGKFILLSFSEKKATAHLEITSREGKQQETAFRSEIPVLPAFRQQIICYRCDGSDQRQAIKVHLLREKR